MSYIGKQYIPVDNSYSKIISNGENKRVYLAGTCWDKPTVTEIVSEPFFMLYKSIHSNDFKNHQFVLIKTSDLNTYLYLFHEHGVVTTDNTIEEILKFRQDINDMM